MLKKAGKLALGEAEGDKPSVLGILRLHPSRGILFFSNLQRKVAPSSRPQ